MTHTPPNPLDLCLGYLSTLAQLELLSSRHRIWETALNFEHDWSNLPEEERALIPNAKEFLKLGAEMRELADRCELTRPLIANLCAATPAALAAKLKIALNEVCPSENADAHALIASAVRDLEAGLRASS